MKYGLKYHVSEKVTQLDQRSLLYTVRDYTTREYAKDSGKGAYWARSHNFGSVCHVQNEKTKKAEWFGMLKKKNNNWFQ